MSSIGRCRLCGEDVPFIVGNPVELGFHMIDRHSNGSIGQYSIDDANQLYQNRDYPESSGLSFDDSDSKSDVNIDRRRKNKKSKGKHKKAHIEGEMDELEEGNSGSKIELKASKSKQKKKNVKCSGSRNKFSPCYEAEDEAEEVSEENELKPSESRQRKSRRKRTSCVGSRYKIRCLEEEAKEEPDEDSEEKELKPSRSRHRKPKKVCVKPTECTGGRGRNRICPGEDDDIIGRIRCRGAKYEGICEQPVRMCQERRTCADLRRRICGDVVIPCSTRQRRSRKRVLRTGLYRTSIEMWTKGSGNIVCPHCQQTVKPLIRNQKTKVAYTSVGAACMLGFWPFCFLFPFLHQCSIELYCSNCKQPLAAKTGHKTKVQVPNLDTTE